MLAIIVAITFEYFYVGSRCGSPELYSVGPGWFEHSFVDDKFVVYREFRFASE
jgi:hypothetical protein